jgi:predicted negative regulator of RcsB-dependent stress response
MSKTLTKKELRMPDDFQAVAGRLAVWLEDNIHIVLALAVVVILGGLSWIGYGYYTRYAETKAEKAIYPAEQSALQTITKATDTGALKLDDYLNTESQYSGRTATATSAVQVIAALQSKENTEGLQKEVLENARFHPSASHVLYGVWHLTEGQVLMKNGELAAAKDAFQKVLDAHAQSEFHPMALLQLGAVAEKGGDLKAARDLYLRVTREFPDSEAKGLAEKFLIHLDLLGKGLEQNS